MIFVYVSIFLFSALLLFWSGTFIVGSLTRIAKFLGWKEFVVAFFIIAIAGAIPNLFVGLSSVLHGIPELSFGDIVGGNLIDLTLAVALAALIAKGLPANSKTVQASALFTIVIAVLPLILIFNDKTLSRGDGVILILTFALYTFWLFSKKERFAKIYDGHKGSILKEFKTFFKDIVKVLVGILFILIAAEGIVRSSTFFADSLSLSLPMIGILIVGFGNAIPETYFAIIAARKGQTWMILGDLMGSVVVTSSLVLGIIVLIHPIEISDLSPFAIARFFLVIAALFFVLFVRTGQKITRKEALFLLGIYIVFVITEIIFNS